MTSRLSAGSLLPGGSSTAPERPSSVLSAASSSAPVRRSIPLSTLQDRPLNKTRGSEVSLSSWAFLFGELVQYTQARVAGIADFEKKLNAIGYRVGLRLVELLPLRDSLPVGLFQRMSESSRPAANHASSLSRRPLETIQGHLDIRAYCLCCNTSTRPSFAISSTNRQTHLRSLPNTKTNT